MCVQQNWFMRINKTASSCSCSVQFATKLDLKGRGVCILEKHANLERAKKTKRIERERRGLDS